MVEIRTLPPASRFALRARPGEARLGPGFPPVPAAPLTSAEADGRAVLWLGPEEFLVLAEPGAVPEVAGGWLVDVSDRQVAFAVEGPEAALLLAEGCPLDLAALPPGGCARTLFGRVEIVLWRRPEGFRLEVGRSYAAHLRQLLEAAAANL
jgi:sarcosine oxidase subunit gamma